MAKLTLSSVAPSVDNTTAINRNFQRVVDELNNKVLYRANLVNQPNNMTNDLDMGGNDIINVGIINGDKITLGDVPLYQILDGAVYQAVEDPQHEMRLNGLESSVAALDTRVEALENYELCLITVNTGTIPLTTEPQTISGNTDIFVNGITRDVEGAIVYPQACRYIVSWTLKLLTSSNVTVYLWVESYLPSTDEWVPVPYSGIQRDLPSVREVEISSSYLRLVPEVGMRFRIRMTASSNGSVSLAPTTLPNGAVMPSVRLDIRN
jgi:hypothetical protein